ncbi:MAG TPA: YihY/virulence factor BrkB family protein [Casimicrobiaceae bacterium]|nr:YihY/virulence factor BrkB family protein [Casimicrobiaceae bacterium]
MRHRNAAISTTLGRRSARLRSRLRPHTDVLRHPGSFALGVLKAFSANQGYLLAGAIAYNTLLSILPLLILALIGLTHFIDEGALLATLDRYLDLVVPGQSDAIMRELTQFLVHRNVVGWLLVATLIFFSAIAFRVVENAMAVIFYHRVRVRPRRLVVSALIPFFFIACLSFGLVAVTLVAGVLQAMERDSIEVFGHTRSLLGFSGFVLYLIGVAGEILALTSIYMVMPVRRPSWRLALIGGVTAGLLWELTRHILVWFFSTLSQVNVVYGSLATAILILLSLEAAAIILLLGAQVIAEYERSIRGLRGRPVQPLRTN